MTPLCKRAEAVKWFRKAADLGNAEAQFQLSWFCETGTVVEIIWRKP